MKTVVDISNVTKRFPGEGKISGFCAVDRLSLRIHEGAVYGLLGLNGSGKSTTIKMLLGLLTPTEGECRLFGVRASEPGSRCEVGYAPESPRFPTHMNGREVLIFYGKLCGLRGNQLKDRVEAMLLAGGLHAAAERRVAHYSKGMLQRLGLAQALVHDPHLVILDEPASGLDVEGVAELTSRLRELKSEGKTILISSHHFGQVAAVCDRIAVLDRGRLVVEDETSTLAAQSGWQHLLVEKLNANEWDELCAWLAARGRKLEKPATTGLALEAILGERIACSRKGGDLI